jgi:YidC/Oxa1 family membrane protein insertase
MDPVQQKVFGFMPWVLMFVMAPFAAGLQLYWTVNNLISIGQQKLLYARHPALKEQAAASSAVIEGTPSPTPGPDKGPSLRKRKK